MNYCSTGEKKGSSTIDVLKTFCRQDQKLWREEGEEEMGKKFT